MQDFKIAILLQYKHNVIQHHVAETQCVFPEQNLLYPSKITTCCAVLTGASCVAGIKAYMSIYLKNLQAFSKESQHFVEWDYQYSKTTEK